MLNFYKKAIAVRKEHKALIYGTFSLAEGIPKPVYCYYRELNGEKYFVELNLGKKTVERPVDVSGVELILSTHSNRNDDVLKPFEGNLYRVL